MECVTVACKLKEFIYYVIPNLIWVFIGFGFGLVVYWLRVGQLKNEISSLLNLLKRRYVRGDEFTIKAGVDLKAADGSGTFMVTTNSQMIFWHERGVDWMFCSQKGLIRSRVVYAAFMNNQSAGSKLFLVSHTYIIE